VTFTKNWTLRAKIPQNSPRVKAEPSDEKGSDKKFLRKLLLLAAES
jgi:hypothetical protein